MEGMVIRRSKKIGMWTMAWRRFRRRPLYVIAFGWILLICVIAIIGPYIAPHNYATEFIQDANQAPSWQHLFGTNRVGQDMFSEVLYSVRFSMEIAVGAIIISFFIGIAAGLWSGMAGGITDSIIMRIVDLMYAFPSYFLNLILVVTLGHGLFPIFLSIGITQWAGHARLVRGLVLSVRGGEMAESARSIGASGFHIARRYMWPNIVGPVIINVAMSFPGAMMQDAGLSVVGMGLQPPQPSFGNLVAAGSTDVLAFPWLLYIPSGIFALTLIAFYLVGNGLQDALNPKGGM
jgi:peptide/nickel transport system permease protein